MTAPAPSRAPGASPRPGRRLLLLALAALLAAGGVALYKTRKASDQAPAAGARERAQPVSVGSVARRDLQIWAEAIGSATPPSLVTLRSRVDGELMQLHFAEGQSVKAGQLLAEIDPRPYQASLTQAQGQLARDRALLDNARRDLARYREMWSQDAIARQQVDTQEALVRQYEGSVEYDRGVVANARLQLDYTRISAPAAGRIGLRNVDPGNQVHASDTTGLASIAQLEPMNVLFTLPETHLPELARVAARAPLQAEAWDREHRKLLANGRLLTMDNQIDAATGTIKLKAVFPNTDHALFPNQFVNIRLLLGKREGAIVVPATALQRGADGSYVYAVGADDKVQAVTVQTGTRDQDLVEITAGKLEVGTRVVTDGADRLRDGASVELIDAAASAPTAPAKPRKARPAAH